MMKLKKLKLGIVGANRRGASFRNACEALENVTIHAVCDTNAEDLPAAAERLGATEQFTDYDEMLTKSDIDTVQNGLAGRGNIWLRTLNDVPNWVDSDSLWNICSFAEMFLPKG